MWPSEDFGPIQDEECTRLEYTPAPIPIPRLAGERSSPDALAPGVAITSSTTAVVNIAADALPAGVSYSKFELAASVGTAGPPVKATCRTNTGCLLPGLKAGLKVGRFCLPCIPPTAASTHRCVSS